MLTIIPRHVALRLFAGALALVLVSTLLNVIVTITPEHRLLLLINFLFDIDSEGNIPAWYSSLLLFLCSLSAWFTAMGMHRLELRDSLYWRGLSATFLLLSLDEMAALHEHGNWIVGMVIEPTSSLLYYPWVLLALVAVASFTLVYFRFWLRLLPRTRMLMFLGALLFCGGAIGVEMIGSLFATRYGADSLARWLTTPFEELLEMSGTILMLYTMLDYAARKSALALKIGLSPVVSEPAPVAVPAQPVAMAD